MGRILSGQAIVGALSNLASGFVPVAQSLLYQSKALGIRHQETQDIAANPSQEGFSFEFQTPMTEAITCQVQGWSNSSKPSSENLVQAACGLMSVHGRSSGDSQALGVNYVSTLTAVMALQSTFAAATAQLRGNAMCQTQVSMASAGLLAVGQYLAGATAPEMPERILPGSASTENRPPFVSADGIVFELETLNPQCWKNFCQALDLSKGVVGKAWEGFLMRYAKATSPLPLELMETFARLPFSQIVEVCEKTQVTICRVRSLEECADDAAIRALWEQGPWEFQLAPTVEPFSNSSQNHAALSSELPLSGLIVVESCRRIQGPLAGHLLALLGAKVIRIEPPGGDPLRGMPPLVGDCSARFDALNRLKSVQEIDIKSAEGQSQVKALVEQADVFLHNWAPNKAQAMGLDDSVMRKWNPALIYAYASGWGTQETVGSPQSSILGTDFMAQAYSGTAQRIADSSGTRGGSLFTVLDVLGGVLSSQAITIALFHRAMKKQGVSLDSSLLSASILLNADGFETLYRPVQSPASSEWILQETYDTQTGKLALDCTGLDAMKRLVNTLGIEISFDEPGALPDLKDQLSHKFLEKNAETWMNELEVSSIPCAVVLDDLSQIEENPELQTCITVDQYTRANAPWTFHQT